MKTISRNEINTFIVNKSKFITYLFRVDNENDVKMFLNKYKDLSATHNCFSYIIDNVKRFDDDGEPSGTAGMPILNVLDKNNLDHVLCLVVRYFGGIKLGAGGLVRAYSNSVVKCLDKCEIITLNSGKLIQIEFNYEDVKYIDNILKNYKVIKNYDEKIIYDIFVIDEDVDKIISLLKNKCIIKIKENILI